MSRLIAMLRRTSLVLRITVAPFLVLVLSMALLILRDIDARQAETAIDAIHQVASVDRGRIDQLATLASLTHSDVSRHLAMVDSGISEQKLAGIRRTIGEELTKARGLVADLRGASLTEPAAGLVAVIATRIDAYDKAVTGMNDMAQTDRLIAIPLMTNVDRRFSELSAGIAEARAAIVAAAEAKAEATRRGTAETTTRFWILTALALLSFAAVSALAARSITGPVSHLTQAMRAIAGGDLDAAVEGTDAPDEVGAMARALEVFKDTARESERLRQAQARMAANAAAEKLRALEAMAGTVETETRAAVARVAERTTAMSGSAEQMAASAALVLGESSSVAKAARSSLANARTVTSAAEEDRIRAYNKNVAGYVLKHSPGRTFIDAVTMLEHYWRVIEFPET